MISCTSRWPGEGREWGCALRGKAGKAGFGAGRMGDVGKESGKNRERVGRESGESQGRSQVRAEESRKRFRRGSERVRKESGRDGE